jgi:hypothetical protein
MGFEVFDQKIFNSNIFYYNVTLSAGVFTITVDLLSNVNETTASSIPKIGDSITFDLYGIHIVGKVSQVNNGSIYTENNNTTVVDFSPGKATPFRFGSQFVNPQYAYSVTIESNTNLLNDYFDSTINSNIRYFKFTDGIDFVRTVSATCDTLESALNSFPTSYSLNLDSDNYINNLTITGRRDNPAGILYYLTSSESRNKITIPTKSFGTVSTSTGTTSNTTSEVPSSPPATTSTNPAVTIPVYPVKYFGCYVSNFEGYLTTNEDGKLNLYLYDDPSTNSTFQPPIINSDFTFDFDGMVFKGVVTRYQELTNSITPDIKKYFVEIACYEGTSNFSDQLFNKDVITFNFSVAPSNTRLDVNSSDINIIAYLNTSSNPSENYGSYFAWNSSSAKYFSIGNVKYTGSKPYTPLYEITGNKSINLSQTVVKSAVSSPANAAASPPTTTTSSSNGGQLTSSFNAFGVGTSTQVIVNSANEPDGTTSSISVDGGLTTKITRVVQNGYVTTTTEQTFSAIPDKNSPLADERRSLMGVSKNATVSIDPTIMYPSTEVYNSGTYLSFESGRYFGKSASPTSHDLDPYFFFTTNDFSLVAKDGISNTTNINVKKDKIKDHVRTMGIKGPMYMSGWGYDVRGLPVPNASGAVKSGEYQFHPDTPKNRGLWKTGPIDLRWHGKRKTWVGGQEMLEGYLLEDLDSAPSISGIATAKMSVLRVATPSGLTGQKLLTQSSGILRDDKGNQTGVRPAIYDHEYITITNRDPSLSASSGTYCIALDINYEWRPIYIGC